MVQKFNVIKRVPNFTFNMEMTKLNGSTRKLNGSFYRTPVAQLVVHRAVMEEVESSTPAGPTLRVLK